MQADKIYKGSKAFCIGLFWFDVPTVASADPTAFILLCITDICMLLSAQSFIALQINTAHSLVTDAVLPFAHSARRVWIVDLCHWASSTHFYAN